jgi:hypothetical protein
MVSLIAGPFFPVGIVVIAADMPDSVKQKRPIHCPLFYRGALQMKDISDFQFLLYQYKLVNHS